MQSAVGRVVMEVRPGVEGDAGAGWVDVGMGAAGAAGADLLVWFVEHMPLQTEG